MYNILAVDDELNMLSLIELFLQKANFTVFKADNSLDAQKIMQSEKIDLILLDIMMPNEDGFTLCEKIRESWDVPIIFLSALDNNEDKVKGLMIGADDYIVKPFEANELIARIHTVMRRYHRTAQQEQVGILQAGPLFIDEKSRKVLIDSNNIELTYKEFELLKLFVKNPMKVFSREQLLDLIWDGEYAGGTRTIDTHIKTLRLKLGKYSKEVGNRIQTVWGIGYRFEMEK